MKQSFLALALAALVAGCATRVPAPVAPPAAPAALPTLPHEIVTVRERYVSAEQAGDELDSLATWTAEDGRTWLIASAKSTHRLVLFDGDSGERLREVGTRGSAPGEFNRPNGVAVHGDLLFVVERDGRRVQVLDLPGLRPVTTFGAGELRSPYGLWITEREPGELDVFVTDNYMYGERFDVVPPLPELAQRVRRYRVQLQDAGAPRVTSMGTFGDTSEGAALRVVESIAGDPEHDRLLIADEDQSRGSTLREYTLGGRSTGRSLPQDAFGAQAEGVALWACGDGEGYWIAVDQLAPLTRFHVFDRRTLAPRGTFQGQVTAHTDGVALHAASTPSFPAGVLYAVHDDRAVAAFDLRDVARALSVGGSCLP
ncbi:phytase [Lysobacter humi (ex Lee et al. 2017)]